MLTANENLSKNNNNYKFPVRDRKVRAIIGTKYFKYLLKCFIYFFLFEIMSYRITDITSFLPLEK